MNSQALNFISNKQESKVQLDSPITVELQKFNQSDGNCEKTVENSKQDVRSIKSIKKGLNFMSKGDAKIFLQLYKLHKSKWHLYKEKLPGKNQSQIKNFFHNSMRNLASRLQRTQKKLKKFQRNVIDTASLHILLDLTLTFKNSLEKTAEQYKKLQIFNTYDLMLYFCFENVEAADQQLYELCRIIRTIKRYFKNLQITRKNAKKQEFYQRMLESMYRLQCGHQKCSQDISQKNQVKNSQLKIKVQQKCHQNQPELEHQHDFEHHQYGHQTKHKNPIIPILTPTYMPTFQTFHNPQSYYYNMHYWSMAMFEEQKRYLYEQHQQQMTLSMMNNYQPFR